MTTLIIAELDKTHLKSSVRQLIGAAQQLGNHIHVLIVGHHLQEAIHEAQTLPLVERILVADHPDLADEGPENVASVVCQLASNYSHILTAASTFGKNFLPRVAAQLDVTQLSEVIAIHGAKRFSRPIYAGSLIAEVELEESIIPMTVRVSAFEPVEGQGAGATPVEMLSIASLPSQSQRIKLERHESARPNLESAKIVVSGGRGLGSQENFHQLLEPLADKLNAALGASRAAVDLGYAPNDYQVGQTGKIVAPQLYLAVGISGAIQHLAGMKNAKCIVAINKDPEAPIFTVADYGLVGDLNELIPALTTKLA